MKRIGKEMQRPGLGHNYGKKPNMRYKDFQDCYWENNRECIFREFTLSPMAGRDKCVICGKHDDKICLYIKVVDSGGYAPIHLNCIDLRYNHKEKKVFQSE